MNNYFVYVKSHSGAPDFEAEFTEEELKDRKCLISYADDTDDEGFPVGSRCGGELEETETGFICKVCRQEYQKEK